MIVLVCGTLIPSLNAQVSADRCPQGRTCLLPAEMDYFLRRDALATKLISDSTEMAGKIEKYQVNEAMYKANEQDLKNQVIYNKSIANNYKIDLGNEKAQSAKYREKAKFRGKVLIGSLSINIAFIATTIVLLKL